MGHPELVADSRHDEVHEIGHGLGPRVKPGGGREHDRTSFRRSLRCTSAARCMRFSPIAWATAASVLPLQGQITIAAVRNEPLATGAIRFL